MSHKEFSMFSHGQNNVLEMIAKGAPLADVLDHIVYLIEKVSNGGLCSILLIDEKSLIHGSAPHLPAEYIEYINGIEIGPTVGSCGTAAFLKRPIVVTDIAHDPLWSDYKDMALKYGLKACWSSPVYDNCQKVIGTFGMYYDKPSNPTETDIQIIEKATDLTSLAIQHYRVKEKINFMAYHDPLTSLLNMFAHMLHRKIPLYFQLVVRRIYDRPRFLSIHSTIFG